MSLMDMLTNAVSLLKEGLGLPADGQLANGDLSYRYRSGSQGNQ